DSTALLGPVRLPTADGQVRVELTAERLSRLAVAANPSGVVPRHLMTVEGAAGYRSRASGENRRQLGPTKRVDDGRELHVSRPIRFSSFANKSRRLSSAIQGGRLHSPLRHGGSTLPHNTHQRVPAG